MEGFSLSNNTDKNKVFLVNQSNLEGRFDSYFYKYDFQLMIESLNNSKFETVPFKKIIKSINNGFDFRDYKDDGIPYIKVANVKQGEFDFSKIQYIDFSSDEITKNIQLKRGNILLTRKGTYGNALSLDKDYDYVISSEVFYIELKTDLIDSKYLEIFFNSNIGQKQFNRVSIGAIMGSLSQEALKTLKIPLPPKDIQQQIIDLYQIAYTQKQQKEVQAKELLASIDAYLLNELGITLPEKDTSLQSRIFTTSFSEVSGGRFDGYYYQKDFIEFFNCLKKGIYPIKSLKKISKKITSGITPLSGGDAYTNSLDGVPFIRSGNIDIDGDIDFEDLLYLKKEIHEVTMKSSKVEYNDLMIAIVGATIGQVGIYNDTREANINQAIALVRLKEEINHNYVKEVIKSSIGQYNLNRLKRPVARANINLEEISTMQIILPPKEKQDEIAAHIQNIRAQAKQLQEEAKAVLEEAKREAEKMILN